MMRTRRLEALRQLSARPSCGGGNQSWRRPMFSPSSPRAGEKGRLEPRHVRENLQPTTEVPPLAASKDKPAGWPESVPPLVELPFQ